MSKPSLATYGVAALASAVAMAMTPSCGGESEAERCERQTSDLFERRIAPLLAADQPKSCNQCHLSGIDISSFVKGDACRTMACLVADGLVDLDTPEESTLLAWIQRAEPESSLITEQVIEQEYDAVPEWIVMESECRSCSQQACNKRDEDPACDVAPEPLTDFDADLDTGACDDKSLEQLFYDTVYAFRGRCYPCHFSSNTAVDAPKWLRTEGSCEASSLSTMKAILNSGYVDTEDPGQSLLLLKPLSEDAGGVEHGGHDKFVPEGDLAYDNFLYFLTRYGACKADP
jgi:hypothetical protein